MQSWISFGSLALLALVAGAEALTLETSVDGSNDWYDDGSSAQMFGSMPGQDSFVSSWNSVNSNNKYSSFVSNSNTNTNINTNNDSNNVVNRANYAYNYNYYGDYNGSDDWSNGDRTEAPTTTTTTAAPTTQARLQPQGGNGGYYGGNGGNYRGHQGHYGHHGNLIGEILTLPGRISGSALGGLGGRDSFPLGVGLGRY